jgi:hypothetical protein
MKSSIAGKRIVLSATLDSFLTPMVENCITEDIEGEGV